MLIRIIGAILTIATVIAAIALWRVSREPVSLNFLGGYIQETLGEATPGYTWEFDDTILDWTDLQPSLAIAVTGVRVREKSGDLVAQVPRVDITLSAKALFSGRLAPTAIELDGASLTIVRLLDGRIRLGTEDTGEPDDPDRKNLSALLPRALDALLAAPGEGGSAGFLERVAIRNVTLEYRDLRLDTLWQTDNASFAFDRTAKGIVGAASIGLKVEDQTWALSLIGNFDRASQQSQIDVSFNGVEPFRLAAQNANLASLSGLRLPVSGNLGMVLGPDGRVLSTHGDLRAGPGEIMWPDILDQPVKVDLLEIAGEYALNENLIGLHRLRLQQGPLNITAAGVLEYGVESPAIKITGDITNANVAAVKQLWPIPLAKGSRAWFLDNIDSGAVDNAHFDVTIPRGELAAGPMTDTAIKAVLQFSDVTGHYLRPMPPMTKARGSATITGRRFELAVNEAAILDNMSVSEGKFTLLNTHLPDKDGEVTLRLNGSVAQTLQLIDSKPLGYPSKYGIDPATFGGSASTQLNLKLPIKKDMNMSEIQFAAASDIHDLRTPGLLNGVPLEQGEIQLEVTGAGIEAKGTGRFLDTEAALTWSEKFGVDESPSSQFTAQMVADEVKLAALGFPTAGLIAGPVNLSAEARGRGSKISDGRIVGDLQNAELIVDPLSWRKPKGIPAIISFDFSLPASGPVLDRLTVTGTEIDVTGRVVFQPEGPPRTITFNRLKLGPVNNLKAEAQLKKSGAYEITLNGEAVDFSPSIQQMRKPDPSPETDEPGTAYELNGHVKQVTLREGNILHDVVVLGSYDGKYFRKLAVDGNYGPERGVTLRLEPLESGNRKFSLLSLDAGKILYGLDLFDSGRNGDFEMEGEFLDNQTTGNKDAPIKGTVRIRNMQVVNAPVLTRILTIASLTGISDILRGSGLTFERIKVPFEIANGVITVDEAYGSGSELGLTLDGTIDQTTGTVNMNGTVIPAYTLNTVLGKVPLLGKLLLGGDNEGVFAINYSATGNTDNPDIFVNPLSALTPGFLRKIFDLGDTGAVAEERPPAPAETAPPAGE